MHSWLDFLTKLQKFPSFAYSWSTCEAYKILDAVCCAWRILAANTNAGSCQIGEYKNSSLVVILHCLNTTTTWHFHYLYVLFRGNHKINAVCFPLFHNGCNPAYKVWLRLRTGEYCILWKLIWLANQLGWVAIFN